MDNFEIIDSNSNWSQLCYAEAYDIRPFKPVLNAGFKVSKELELFKLQLHTRFFSNSLIHILSLSNLHNNVASIQKNRDDKSQRVIVALDS